MLSRFDDVWRAVNDAESFSSVVAEAENFLPQMIYIDPPRHTQLRALVSRAFTPKRVAEVEPLTRSVARSLVEKIAERGSCELQHEYASIIPSVVIAKMIGVPEEHIEEFRSWTESFLEIQGPEAVDGFGALAAPAGDLNADHIPDVVIGATSAAGQGALAYIVYGKGDGGAVDLASPSDAALPISAAGAGGLQSLAAGADLDGDGRPDVVVGPSDPSSGPATAYATSGGQR